MTQQIKHLSRIAGTALLLAMAACSDDSADGERDINLTTGNEEPAPGMLGGTMANDYRDITVEITPYATVVFNAADGSRASGNLQFIGEERTRIIGRLVNLPPGDHGLRIVEQGDCSSVTGIVASRIGAIRSSQADEGAALPDDSGFIGNITVGPDNLASIDMQVDDLMLDGPRSIIGKAMVVATAEDQTEEPAAGETVSDFGHAIACGVIILNDVTSGEQAPAVP